MPIHTSFEKNLLGLTISDAGESLADIRRGLEKESLRITPNGRLSQTPHPSVLGSALTHPNITTDYSESLLELITEPHQSIDTLLNQLSDIHRFIYQHIDQELLWVNSMPCIVGDDLSIPIAQYGNSNIGRMKTIYRHGLWHRYGRLMQAIAGIHFNFSLPKSFWGSYQVQQENNDSLQSFISEQYFKLIRNFQRYAWLPVYLFGASPAICSSFIKNRQHGLHAMSHSEHTYHLQHATSLRMSDLGYQNDAQSDLMICYNTIDSYTQSLEQAINTVHKPYEEIGIKTNQGYKQLNANILQIENEFYSNIRPKQTAKSNERPTQALRNRGVEYIEIRCLDLNPFEPLGLNKSQIQFLDAFLMFCLLEDDVKTSHSTTKNNKVNMDTVVYQGRDPKAMIYDDNNKSSQTLTQAATHVLEKVAQVACIFDNNTQNKDYQLSVQQQQEKIKHPEMTTSGEILNTLKDESLSFFEFSLQQAKAHKQFFNQHVLAEDKLKTMRNTVKESHQKQKEIENADNIELDSFIANYFTD